MLEQRRNISGGVRNGITANGRLPIFGALHRPRRRSKSSSAKLQMHFWSAPFSPCQVDYLLFNSTNSTVQSLRLGKASKQGPSPTYLSAFLAQRFLSSRRSNAFSQP